MEVWPKSGGSRSNVLTSHYSLPEHHNRDASRECVSMQKFHSISLFNRHFWQYIDYFGRDIGNFHPPVDQLYTLGECSPRNGTPWLGCLGFRHALRGRHVYFRGAAQAVCTQEATQSFFPEWRLSRLGFRF